MPTKSPALLIRDRLDPAFARLESKLERRLNPLILWTLSTALGAVGVILEGFYFVVTNYKR